LHQLNAMAGFAVARRDRVLVERVGDEVVLYDQEADVAHCLPASVAAVWEHADGTRSDQQLATITGLTRDALHDALEELHAAELTVTPPGHTRREAAKRILRTGALAAAAPLIYTVAIAPATAMASAGACLNTGCQGESPDQATAQAQANAFCPPECPLCDGPNAGILTGPPDAQVWVVTGVCYS
jgi:hypothetical protein